LLGLAIMLYSMQAPRAFALLVRAAPALNPMERQLFTESILQHGRAAYLRREHHDWQVRVLARIDRARPIARRMKASPEALKRIFADILVPGTIDGMMVDLLDLPPDQPGAQTDAARLRAALGSMLRAEPEPRPSWLDPKDPWPPKN
jgi:hypothetical protein